MKIKQYAAFALIGLALGACNKPGGDGPDVVEPEGRIVKTKLAINVPNSIRTYAPGDLDNYATSEEKVANSIDVFIYEDGGSYALTYYRFDPAATLTDPPGAGEFAYNAGGTQFITADFDVREGPKLVYVGINLPSFIVNRLRTGYFVNEIFQQTDLIDELVKDALPTGSGELAFFNTAIVEHDVDADGENIPVSVSRLVAKVIVMAEDADGDITAGNDASWDVNGGTVSNLEFAIGQRNNQMFVSPLVGGVDPNYVNDSISVVGATSTPGGIQKLQFVDENDYLAVNDININREAISSSSTTHIRYATENTSENHRHQDVTYVSVKAQFIPHRIGADAATGKIPDDGSSYNNAPIPGGFYAVFTGESVGTSAIGVRYFADLEDARDFVMGAFFGGLAPDLTTRSVTGTVDNAALNTDSDHYIHFYEDSYCYYRIYLNPTLGSDGNAGTGTQGYNILRNTVYLATVTGVNYIGTTAPDHLPGSVVYANGKGTPTYPGAWLLDPLPHLPIANTDQIDPLDLMTGLGATITLSPWDTDDQDYEVY